jgi:metallo-beta-lactamase family protein
VKIQFCGAAGTVTGSCFLVLAGETKFLVDCGMFQGSKELKERNYGEFIFDPTEIQFVILTHAHIDHSGLIPKLYKKGFKGNVYCTKATSELCAVVLPDSGYIQEMEVERKNRKNARSGAALLEPIYTALDAQNCLRCFQPCSYNETLELTSNVRFKLLDAGHILGSAIIELYINEDGKETKVIFTGDLGNINQPIVEDPTKVSHADVVVLESTYGNRYHLETENKLARLTRVIKNTYKKGGNLVIPSFAVERAQDLIYDLLTLKEKGEIPPMKIFIDSPMAIEATKVFINNPDCFDEEAAGRINENEGQHFFEDPSINYVLSAEQSIALNKLKGGAIIISASGMADAGRIKHHLKHNLWRHESTVLFVGYQAEGTLGRRILEGEKKVRIHGEEVAVKADVEVIDGYSAHADQKGLMDWLKHFDVYPPKIFLVHGEKESLETLQRVISSELGVSAEVARYGLEYDLAKNLSIPIVETEKGFPGSSLPVLNEVFYVLKDHINELAKDPGKDLKILQRLLAQVNEIERELSKVS